MFFHKFGDTYAIRLERGEELAASLKELCVTERVRLGTLSGLGAMDHVVVGVYDLAEKRFCPNVFDEPLEMTGLEGSVTEREGEPYLHIHASFRRADGSVIGGHLSEARVSATAELFLRALAGRVGRVFDEETGLNLLDFRLEG